MKLNNVLRTEILHNICERHFGGRIKDYKAAVSQFAANYVRDEIVPWEKIAKTHNFPEGTLAARTETYISLDPKEKDYEGSTLFFFPSLRLSLSPFSNTDSGIRLYLESRNQIPFSRAVPIGYRTELKPQHLVEVTKLAKQVDKILKDFEEMKAIVVPMVGGAKTTEQLITMWEPMKEHIPTNINPTTGCLPISVDAAKKLNEILK